MRSGIQTPSCSPRGPSIWTSALKDHPLPADATVITVCRVADAVRHQARSTASHRRTGLAVVAGSGEDGRAPVRRRGGLGEEGVWWKMERGEARRLRWQHSSRRRRAKNISYDHQKKRDKKILEISENEKMTKSGAGLRLIFFSKLILKMV